mgnify:CR=1 FL=1
MAQSSDAVIKNEIRDQVGTRIGDLTLRVFAEGSREDQNLFDAGGLTFTYDGQNYGSCDAGYVFKKDGVTHAFMAIEGTDCLNRDSGGNAQYQRFHHALGAVRAGIIGVYYLKPGTCPIQPDLYGMAYNASKKEKGTYLICNDLIVVKKILELRSNPNALHTYLDLQMNVMKAIYDAAFKARYKSDMHNFASKRSTVIQDKKVIKYAARRLLNFTDSSQRAGHIAVGEMYLTKYLFPDHVMDYLFLKMTAAERDYLDKNKANDKEWSLLRKEPGVRIVTLDDLQGLDPKAKQALISIKDLSGLKGAPATLYNSIKKLIHTGLESGAITIKD